MSLPGAVLAASLSLSATAPQKESVNGALEGILDAKNAVVEAALAVRQARLDWEKATAQLNEAEDGLQAARIEHEKVLEQGKSEGTASAALTAADEQWRHALSALEAQGVHLGRAEKRLHDAEAVLTLAEAQLSSPKH